jgi:hypothetical protein
MGKHFTEEEEIPAIFSDAAQGASAIETAEYIHDMLAGLHTLAFHPRNKTLRVLLWLTKAEAERIIRLEIITERRVEWKKSTSGEPPSC